MKTIKKLVMALFFVLIFLNFISFSNAIAGEANYNKGIIDPNIQSTMRIIQYSVQCNTLINGLNIDASQLSNKIIAIPVSKELFAQVNEKLKLINKEVDSLCANLINNKISPYVLLSITSAIKNNIHNSYHLYPFFKALKTYLVQNNLPQEVKKAIIELTADCQALNTITDKRTFLVKPQANVKLWPATPLLILGAAALVGAGVSLGSYVYASYQNGQQPEEPINYPIEMHEYTPYLWEYVGVGR